MREKPDLKLLAILAPIDVWRSRFGSGRFRAVSIELEYSPEPEIIVECVTEAYEKTDAIMQNLKCRH